MNFSCDCGATDCPNCGPAQGHKLIQVWRGRKWVWVHPEDLEDDGPADDHEPDYAAMAEDGRMSL